MGHHRRWEQPEPCEAGGPDTAERGCHPRSPGTGPDPTRTLAIARGTCTGRRLQSLSSGPSPGLRDPLSGRPEPSALLSAVAPGAAPAAPGAAPAAAAPPSEPGPEEEGSSNLEPPGQKVEYLHVRLWEPESLSSPREGGWACRHFPG